METNQAIQAPHVAPAIAVKGNATGLIMMAVFTTMWTAVAYHSIHNSPFKYALVIFPALASYFAVYAVKQLTSAKYYPALTTEADKARGKNTSRWFGIVFGAEGLGIFIAVNVVVNLGHPDLTISAIALVVGLHFYPMAKIFRRTIDYYLATWSTLAAILGFVFILNKILTEDAANVFVGVGLATATSCYGWYMISVAKKFAKQVIG
jgi:hypothetical protein